MYMGSLTAEAFPADHVSESASLNDLVRGAQSGEQGDLDELMTTLRPMICRWAVVWSGSPDVAEDRSGTGRAQRSARLRARQRRGRWVTRFLCVRLGEHDGRTVVPVRPPKASVRRILLKGVPLGMTIVEGIPSLWAWEATPCA